MGKPEPDDLLAQAESLLSGRAEPGAIAALEPGAQRSQKGDVAEDACRCPGADGFSDAARHHGDLGDVTGP